MNMATGTVSIVVGRFYFGRGTLPLEIICIIFFALNLILYLAFVSLTVARFHMFPSLFRKMIFNTTESLFLGAFPIGSATLLDAALLLNQTYGLAGSGLTLTLWAFWWIVLLLAYLLLAYSTAFGMIYTMMSTRNHMIKETTSLWVLPIIPLIVASATGGNMSHALLSQNRITLATVTTAFSLVSFGIGMSLTLMIITLFLTRLILHGPPKPQIVVSGFIIASPLGTGGYSLLVNGRTLTSVFPGISEDGLFSRVEHIHEILYGVCFAAAFALWSMGTCWILISIFTIILVKRDENIPFTLTYWGAVFPNGVYALCTAQLGSAMNSPFFNYLSVVWSGVVFCLWLGAFVPTILHTLDTSIFPESTPDQLRPSKIGEGHTKRTNSYHAFGSSV